MRLRRTNVMGAALEILEAGAEACALCFPAGTLVATPAGERAIQTLHMGERVQAEDPQTGKVEPEPVQAVIQDPVSPLIAVDLSDGSAITVTADHPFWLDVDAALGIGGWLPAGQLRAGDRLRTTHGTDVRVVGLQRGVGRAAVYTLTVARDHTFFVDSARVLVHNGTCPVPLSLKAKDFIHVIYRHLNSSELAQALAASGKVSAKDLASTKPAGQFLAGITSGELRQWIIEAFAEANRLSAFELQGTDRVADLVLDRFFRRTISGSLTKSIRIIVRADGALNSIYPLG